MNPNIFRAYDIRGKAGTDLTPEILHTLGKSYGTHAIRKGLKKVSLARDCRLSSPEFSKSFKEGALTTGLDVVDVGMCPTPVLYFSLFNLDVDGGVMITGSHNPPDQNGLKLCIGKSTIHNEEIQELRKLADAGDFEVGEGTASEADMIQPYLAHLKDNLNMKSGLSVIIDAGNGVGGMVAPQLFRDLGCNVREMFCEPDGNFPNHHSDPTVPENLVPLQKAVVKDGADLGVAYDGDSDRIGVIDEKGNIVWGDMLMIILSREILSRRPDSAIIAEVKCSQRLYDDIEAHGGRGIMWKTGHSLIKAKMKEEKAALAGEMSGHIFYEDRYFGFDDAIYTTGRLLEIMSHSGKRVTELLDGVPQAFTTPEIRFDCSDDKKFDIIEKLLNDFRRDQKVIDIDGARIVFPDGWGLARASNTQPKLVLRFEAQTEERMNEIRKIVEDKIAELTGE
ncbi:phosphomannomutase/phosphoglucomutase [Candidatus Hydrogenedentota bacterium]